MARGIEIAIGHDRRIARSKLDDIFAAHRSCAFLFLCRRIRGLAPGRDDPDLPPEPPPSGIVGRFQARYRRFQAAWKHADSGALLWMRHFWDWLHTWAHPDETMLARLRSARAITVRYPALRDAAEVRLAWSTYLGQQWRRHLVWLVVNGLIAPFSVLFAILPGPNLIGYWFAYRAIHHMLVVWGIRRARGNKIATEFVPIAALDIPIEPTRGVKSRHPALPGAAARLHEHVKWHTKKQRSRFTRTPSLPSISQDTAQSANPESELL